MRVIIIEDKDAKNLISKLELEKFKISKSGMTEVSQIHRQFHYIVAKWLQEQGAELT